MDLYFKINDLINSKNEGSYWDFKSQPHSKNEDLLHDIICLANTNHNGDRYLIIGVADPNQNCEIIGLDETTENRKGEADINDFLSTKKFAGGNIPKINLRKLNFNDKKVDVIIVKNSNLKPFYLEEDYRNVKAYRIYTRTGDKNTPKDKNASYSDIKSMWKEHFGLNLNVEERFKMYLTHVDDWKLEIDTKESAYYMPIPNFSIELTNFFKTDYVEPFSTFYLNNAIVCGDVLFKYDSQVIAKCGCSYCDGVRVLIPIPTFYNYQEISNKIMGFYYYNLGEFNGLFANLLFENSITFEGRIHSFPFIIVNNHDELGDFINFLDENFDISEIQENKLLNLWDPNKYSSSVDLGCLTYFVDLFNSWKDNDG